MLLNNCKKILFSIVILACSVTLFAATTDLSVRFLDKANLAFEDNNIEDAYKYVNQALAVAKDKESQANVLYFAQTVYSVKLQNLLGNYDEMAFIDIQMNLEKYPNVENTKIKNCLKNERKFDFLWNEITSTLKPSQQIPNWTKHSGFLESEFEICSITNNAIEVFTIKDKHHRSIPKTDFENIFSKWDKYISGEIKRNELRDENKNTTYIISILKIFCKT